MNITKVHPTGRYYPIEYASINIFDFEKGHSYPLLEVYCSLHGLSSPFP